MPDERSRSAVEIGERFADGLAGRRERGKAHVTALAATRALDGIAFPEDESGWSLAMSRSQATAAASVCAVKNIAESIRFGSPLAAAASEYEGRLRQVTINALEMQTAQLRCMFGNLFRPVTIAPAWLRWNDATVLKLAQSIYDSRDFSLLPILADALEDAGCDNADILAHCRGPGPHVRGCWVVDLLLGKS
jgi:hypothetical protein